MSADLKDDLNDSWKALNSCKANHSDIYIYMHTIKPNDIICRTECGIDSNSSASLLRVVRFGLVSCKFGLRKYVRSFLLTRLPGNDDTA